MSKKPTKAPPGLDHEPAPEALTGFSSLLPPPAPKGPGLVSRIVRAPVRLVALPFRLIARIVAIPARAAAGRRGDTTTD